LVKEPGLVERERKLPMPKHGKDLKNHLRMQKYHVRQLKDILLLQGGEKT
jgi:hypothetical protein